MDDYQIRSLQDTDLKQMHRSFLEAFSDYPVPMQLTYPQFQTRMVTKLNIAFDLSVGAFSGEKLVGFLLHTSNMFQQIPTLYNGGTGVIPGHRGNALTLKMFEFVLNSGLLTQSRIVLETLATNSRAMSVYERAGFLRKRFFLCFRLQERQGPLPSGHGYTVRKGSLDMVGRYRSFDSHDSCFSDSLPQLQYNWEYEQVLECYAGDQLAGYLIYQPEPGRISRIAVDPMLRGRGVGSTLLSHAYEGSGRRPLYVINVPEDAVDVQQFLINRGFENQIDQWEMELKL